MSPEEQEELLGRLRRLASAVDAPPAHIEEAGRAAFSTRNLDELARLLMDSETRSPVLTRGEPGAVRMLSFAVGAVSVELQVTSGRSTVSLRGLVQGASGPVTVESPAGLEEVQPDDYGWFTVDDVAAGMCRLRLHAVGGGDVTTEWVDL